MQKLSNYLKCLKNNKNGFLLIDSIVGVLVLVIGLAGLALLYTHGTNASVQSDKMQAAVQIAGQEMERLKKLDGQSFSEIDLKEEVLKVNKLNSDINGENGAIVVMQGYSGGDEKSLTNNFVVTTIFFI